MLKSSLGDLVATSTALAELEVTYWTAIDVVGIRNLMEELGFPQDKAAVVYTDNNAVKSIISGRMSLGSKNKHVELRCLKTKEWHRRAFIEIETERTSYFAISSSACVRGS